MVHNMLYICNNRYWKVLCQTSSSGYCVVRTMILNIFIICEAFFLFFVFIHVNYGCRSVTLIMKVICAYTCVCAYFFCLYIQMLNYFHLCIVKMKYTITQSQDQFIPMRLLIVWADVASIMWLQIYGSIKSFFVL